MCMDPIILPDAPGIAGLSLRSIRGEQDAEALHAVHEGRMARDGVDPLSNSEDLPSVERLCESLSRAVAAGEGDWRLVAQIGECVVGYSQIGGRHQAACHRRVPHARQRPVSERGLPRTERVPTLSQAVRRWLFGQDITRIRRMGRMPRIGTAGRHPNVSARLSADPDEHEDR